MAFDPQDVALLWAVVLGALGGLFVEFGELYLFLKRNGHRPWSSREHPRVVKRGGELRRFESVWIYLFAVVIRVLLGAMAAGALRATGSMTAITALASGVGSYAVLDRLANLAVVHDGTSPKTEA